MMTPRQIAEYMGHEYSPDYSKPQRYGSKHWGSKNKSTGQSKKRRKMAQASRRANR